MTRDNCLASTGKLHDAEVTMYIYLGDGIFYPHLTIIKDSYILAHYLGLHRKLKVWSCLAVRPEHQEENTNLETDNHN